MTTGLKLDLGRTPRPIHASAEGSCYVLAGPDSG